MADGDRWYPPGPAAQIAEQVRGADAQEDADNSSNTSAAQASLPPTAVPQISIVPPPTAKLPGLPVVSRQGAGLPGLPGLPGVANRKEEKLKQPYVTETVLTPLPKSDRLHLPVPVARRNSSSSGSGDESLQMPKLSMLSSFTSIVSKDGSQLESNVSFRWTPEVLTQCWHRALSETYEDFNMVDVLGEGQFGSVCIVQHKLSGRYYACKVLIKADHDPRTLRREIDTMRSVDHPNVVRLYEAHEDQAQEAVYLLMELCNGGDLLKRIQEADGGCGYLAEKEVKVFAEQMLSAVAYCHKKNIVHRDIKPENLLLASRDPECRILKLTDFGLAARIRPKNQSIGRGHSHDTDQTDGGYVISSVPYMAPELFQQTWKSLTLDSEVALESQTSNPLKAGDCWSCGIVIYVMLSGDMPYCDEEDEVTQSIVCSGVPPDFSTNPVWRSVSSEAKDLICKLVNHNIAERWTATQALDHEWFTTGVTSPLNVDGLPGVRQSISDRNTEIVDTFGALSVEQRWDLAQELLRCLRRWRDIKKLRRVFIAAIAKRLEDDHPSKRFARTCYRAFSGSPDELKCDHLAEQLTEAITEANTASVRKSLTGMHLRESIGNTISSVGSGLNRITNRFAQIFMDTPTADYISSPENSPGLYSPDQSSVDVREMRILVDALDSMKSGAVNYTLLVAAVLPPDVYCDEQRTAEAFHSFDFRKQGGISPDCLVKLFPGRDTSAEKFVDLIAEFDTNNDGVLDLEEFRDMLRDEHHAKKVVTRSHEKQGRSSGGYADVEVVRTPPQCSPMFASCRQ